MVIAGYQLLFVLVSRGQHEPFNAKVNGTDEVLLAVNQLNQIASSETVWRLLGY